MKPLTELTQADKAKLLHDLFPQDVPALLKYLKGVCEAMQDNPQVYHQLLDNRFASIDEWQSYTMDMNRRLEQYGNRFSTRSRLFGDQLFDGALTVFTLYCLKLYTQTVKHPNEKFTAAIKLLFDL
jgi:hypothetical protein